MAMGGYHACVLGEGNIRQLIAGELREIRRYGLESADELDTSGVRRRPTPNLDHAAKRVSGTADRLTNSAAIRLLLEREIPLITAHPCRNWLPASFGLTDEALRETPTERRVRARRIAGIPSKNAFERTGGEEDKGIRILAAQIAVDCFQEVDAGAANQENEDPDLAIFVSPSVPHITPPSRVSPEPARLQRVSRKTRYAIAGSCLTLAIAGTLVYALAPDSHSSSKQNVGNPAPSGSHSSVALASAGKSGALPPDFKINATLGKLNDGTGGYSVAFPEDKLADAAPFLKAGLDPMNAQPGNEGPPFVIDELNHGGYFVGGIIIEVNLDTPSTREIAVDNVELVNIQRLPTATGALVAIGAQGDDTFQMRFDIRQANPVPKLQPTSDTDPLNDPFFDVKHIGVSATNSQALKIYVPDAYGAYAFDIKIDYELAGHHDSISVTRDGQHFRITSDVCPAQNLATQDTPAQLADLKSKPYQYLTVRTAPNSGAPDYQVTGPTAMYVSDPSTYVSDNCHY